MAADEVYDDMARQYTEALIRGRRATKYNLTLTFLSGWTLPEFQHWVQTGEQPADKPRVFE